LPALSAHPQSLLTLRLTLAPLGPEHATALFEAFADAEVWRFIPSEPPVSPASLAARFARTVGGPAAADERWWNWAVALRAADNVPFGSVELSLARGGRHATLAYMFGRRAWGYGYACEACGAALDYLREAAPVATVDALIDTRNARSIALARRLRFERIETLANADYFKGSASDEYRYRWRPPARAL